MLFRSDRATIKIGVPSFELLFRSRQGAIQGLHPETDGYFTTPHGGFEYAKNPPEMPEWLYQAIANAFPTHKYQRKPSSGVLTQQINLHYEEGSKFQQEEAISEVGCCKKQCVAPWEILMKRWRKMPVKP